MIVKIINKIIIGIIVMQAPADILPQSTMFSPWNEYNPTDNVLILGLLIDRINGYKKEFHVHIDCVITTVPIIGFESGNIILKKIL